MNMEHDMDEPTYIEPRAQSMEAEIIEDELMISSASFAVDMSGIQRDIEDLTYAIDDALTVYGDMLEEADVIAAMDKLEARERERELSRAVRTADELRRKLNRDYKTPLDAAKRRYDELMGPVIALRDAYKQRRIEFEEAEKEQKRLAIRTLYETMAPHIALPVAGSAEALVPFERIFDAHGAKWLNKGTDFNSIELEIGGIVRRIDESYGRLQSMELKHATEVWALFWRTLDIDAALARERELCILEEQQAALAAKRALAASQPAAQAAPAATDHAPEAPTPPPAQTRKPRVMLIDGATDDECRQIAALCSSLGITGIFKGPAFYEAVKNQLL